METNNKLREALKSVMDNLQIHAVMPCEQITMNRAEVCAMIEDCRAALAATPKSHGDGAKMREALDDIIDRIDTWRGEGSMEHWQYSQLFDIADAALAALDEKGGNDGEASNENTKENK